METTGGWLKQSKRFLDDLAAKLATARGQPIEIAKCRMYRALSSTLQRGNIKCLLHHHAFPTQQD